MSKKKLVSLEEWEAQHAVPPIVRLFQIPNGIACPRCGEEMYDTPGVPRSHPPRKFIACKCGYKNTRLV